MMTKEKLSMNKIIVEIYIPIIGKSYDVFIPKNKKLYEVSQLLAKSISDLTDGMFVMSDNNVLCDLVTGQVLDINLSVNDLGLKNGSRLMLI